ncbi:MAG: CHC2 zinc finger domain-containing protein [Kiritimatiellia bacterium]|nr:CHC2 zinc finger domain-containing protein [Kiritimatiellia bacterium]
MIAKIERLTFRLGHRTAYRNHTANIPLRETLAQAKDRLTVADMGTMLFPDWQPGKICRSPFRKDRKPSFSVFDDGRRWRDFGTGEHGDGIDFLARARGLSNTDAVKEFLRLAGVGGTRDAVHIGAIIPCGMKRIESAHKADDHRKPVLPDDLRPGGYAELSLLAKLRNFSIEALTLATERGLLWFATIQDGDSRITGWIITDQDRRNAQARRLDGLTWQSLPGHPKAKTLPGSQAAWPIGLNKARSYPCMALVEGGPDLLAAFHFVHCESRQDHVVPVAMLGASLSILDDALPYFTGKRVRIFPHLDVAGQDAAARWEGQLVAAGAEVDCFALTSIRKADGSAVKDLNDLSSIHADDFEDDRALWNLFNFAEVAHE